MSRWPLHLASFLVYSAAFWLSILYYRRTGRNGVSFVLVVLLLGHAAVFFGVMLLRAVFGFPLTDWIVWWANVLQFQAGFAALIIFGRALRA